jgi:hypothetical protein
MIPSNDLTSKISSLEGFADEIRRTTENERQSIELQAHAITTTTPRHLFRQKMPVLANFARVYDAFVSKYGLKGNIPDRSHFSVYVKYIRGIAAHYGNDPSQVTLLLGDVVKDHNVQAKENEEHRNKRHAVAHYFLGLTESNFGNYEKAIEEFQQAIDFEWTPKDVLSRLVAAEAAAFADRTTDAKNYLQDVEKIISDQEKQSENEGKKLSIIFRRYSYRATLIRANMAIISGHFDEAEKMLRLINDPHEYYALATLAQLLNKQKPTSEEAKMLFEEAYLSIRDLGDLNSVTEVRSKILLLLVAGMSSQFAEGYEAMMDEHFLEAENLLASLPDRGGEPCTVFSPLTKKMYLRAQSKIISIACVVGLF